MRVLVVEDEEKVASFLRKGLREDGHAVDLAYDGQDGLDLAESNSYDIIILDLMLPGIDGFEIIRTLREHKNHTPILVLSAKEETPSKIEGLNCGCDDYLTKPFSFDELLARMAALLRRYPNLSTLTVDDLVVDPVAHKVMRGGRRLDLTSKEYALLEYLMRNAGRIVSRAQIAEHVWEVDFDTYSNVIDVHLNHLRQKVDGKSSKKLINTIRGMGYLLEVM